MVNDNIPLLGQNPRNSSYKKAINISGIIWKSSLSNYLLFFVPLGILSGYLGWGATSTFWLNFFAIIPLASLLAFATEELAAHVGQTLGGLLNATFGNAVELIVSIIALKDNQVRIVQASMLGSILSNLLLVLGCCFVAGGFNRVQQQFNQTAAQTMTSLLALATAGLLIPAAFHASLPVDMRDGPVSAGKILQLSRGAAIVLLIIYVLYLVFQLKTHSDIFADTENEVEQATQTETHESELSAQVSIAILVVVTLIVSICADLLVGSIDDIVASSGLSKTFIGLIVIPIVGNATEHVTAIVVAMKDKMDLAIGIAIGSSLQIALFVTPFLVLVGWAIDVPMTLYFSTFETAVLFVSMLITNYLILDGESNWLEGAMLLGTYSIIAMAFFFLPDVELI